MGFDFWTALGISPMAGLALAGAALAFAALLALRIFLRGRRVSVGAGGLRLGDRPPGR